ncbi:MAG: cadherin-like domain-containing protein [Gammaproteobacteria bacterium]|nr:cadherin-like domain-containing protein [Gammaproteobacteria bacterium]
MAALAVSGAVQANTAPVAGNLSFGAASNAPLRASLSARDAEGASLRFESLSRPRNGTLSLNPDGQFTYQARRGFQGSDSFSFRASDGQLLSNTATANITIAAPSPADTRLSQIIRNQRLTGDAASGRQLPRIEEPLPQLGMQLFFSKSLGGGFDAACVSCHHPVLGGADGLSLSVGVGALRPELLGLGRRDADGSPAVPRNAPTVFNAGLWDTSLFWDSRVESLGKEPGGNGALSGIRTPDSLLGIADPAAGGTLPSAQARFPVTNADEMKTASFEAEGTNSQIRAHLAARIGGYGVGAGELTRNEWLAAFQTAFVSGEGAESLVSFDNIAKAIAEYERSLVFTNNAWKRYVQGDLAALTADQKAGAQLFFTPPNQGGAGCAGCHRGDLFSDGLHHTVAFPQIGPGKGDGQADDFGRERETRDPRDRYRFRTPSLLNIELSAPYGHAGAYRNLGEVVRHYVNPPTSVNAFFANGGWCRLPQFQGVAGCAGLYPNAAANSQAALRKLGQDRQARVDPPLPGPLNAGQQAQLVAFLRALTDPCVKDRQCLASWIPAPGTTGPDGQQLNAVDAQGRAL